MLARRSLLAAAALAPLAAQAQDAYPSRPIRIVIAYPPGGSTDVLGRAIAQRLSEMWNGAAVVVENRAGGAAIIGTQAVAQAAPDGYTLALGNNQTHASNQAMARTLPYHAIDSFTPIARLASVHHALIVPANGARTLQELVAKGTGGGRVTYASTSVGSASHVIGESLARRFGMDATHVPYRGGAPAVQDAVAGTVPLFMSNVVIISQHIAAGTLRPLGVTTRGETRHVPGVRSFAQQGVGDFEAPTWWAFLGRAGTPQPILDRMHQALTSVLNEPAVKQRIEQQGCDIVAGSPEQCRQFLAAEIDKWGAVIRANNITADS
ncbi:MAG: Bug family tripartite tricarboxylate transporter substrate binding protein [Elioraea tepidiphila]